MESVAVIGGGPSGIMAAITAAEGGSPVVVFDRAAPGATILRTGGGRCNLANAVFEAPLLAENYPRGGMFLISAFSRFGARETLTWFRGRGLPLVEEEEGRVFPASGRAADVRDLLLAEARRLGVRLRGGTAVRRLERTAQGFNVSPGRSGGAQAPPVPASAVIIATGGDWKCLPGSGYGLARSLGHSITALAPSLTALLASDRWTHGLSGVTLRRVRARAFFDGRRVADEIGDLLFTHRGISGPLALRISSRTAFLPLSGEAPIRLSLSLVPDLSPGQAEKDLQGALIAHPRQTVAAALGRYAPRSLALVLLGLAEVEPVTCCSQITRTQRMALGGLLCGLPLSVTGREKGSEMVSAGGVALDEVTPSTMESRLVPGLFFCGEVLDIDGFTGGFNLQAAWSTGYLAGLGACRVSRESGSNAS
jgi:predicted Rossmann fold flavoprotein